MLSWYLAEASEVQAPRDRRIVAWAGFSPDVDVLAYVAALVYYRGDKDLAFENVWSVVHHRYTHGISFVLVVGVAAWFLASGDRANRARIAMFAAAAAALHCFLDVVGGGPTWPIYPYWPVSSTSFHAEWSWTIGQWPNIVLLFLCLAGIFIYARLAGRSPMECFGDRADGWLVRVVRQEDGPASGASTRRTRLIIWATLAIVVVAILYPLGFNPFQ